MLFHPFGGRSRSRNSVGRVAVVLLLGLSHITYAFSGATTTISLATLAEDLKAQRVQRISVYEDHLEIVFRNGQHASARKATNSSLSDTVRSLGVDPGLLRNVQVDIEPNTTAFSPRELLPLVIPIGLAVVTTYLVLYFGLRIFHVEPIPRSKLVIATCIVFCVEALVPPLILRGQFAKIHGIASYVLGTLETSALNLLALRFFFGIVGRTFWQFLVYLLAVYGLIWLVVYLLTIQK
jgi:hypothetical protein